MHINENIISTVKILFDDDNNLLHLIMDKIKSLRSLYSLQCTIGNDDNTRINSVLEQKSR